MARTIEFIDFDSGAVFHTVFCPDGGEWVLALAATRRAASQNFIPPSRVAWRAVVEGPPRRLGVPRRLDPGHVGLSSEAVRRAFNDIKGDPA